MSCKPKRKPRPVILNPLELIKARIGRVTTAECNQIMGPVRKSFRALREGVATEWDWCNLASMVAIGLSIEDQGVIRGMREHLVSADLALQAVARRARAGGTWQPTSLYFQELDDISTAVDFYPGQIKSLSAREYIVAMHNAEKDILAMGGRVYDALQAEKMEQAA